MQVTKKTSLAEIKAEVNEDRKKKQEQKTVIVYGTGKGKHLKAGVAYTVGIEDAELLVKSGQASKEQLPAKKDASKEA